MAFEGSREKLGIIGELWVLHAGPQEVVARADRADARRCWACWSCSPQGSAVAPVHLHAVLVDQGCSTLGRAAPLRPSAYPVPLVAE